MSSKKRVQIAVIVYGNGINVRAYADEYKARGFLVLYCAGYAAVYKE